MIMRKLFILLGVMVISLILTACTSTVGEVTPPSFVGVRIEYTDPVNGDDFYTFYRGKQETVLVEVTLDNPSDVDIKSIVIEGYTHNSNKFKENSTNEVIYFDLNVGSTLGSRIYSVDRINYLNGDNSVSVNITTNNQFELYVYKDAPTVTRENYALTREQISIDFNVVDTDQVITPTTLKAYLYAGETLVESKEIQTGLITVSFNGLLANRLYEVKIIASYDLDDNTGSKNNAVLYSGSYSTVANGLPSATISNVEITSNTVTFDVSYTDTDQVVVPGGLRVAIYNGDTLVDTMNITGSTTGLSFDDLLNDNLYVIKVLADYDLKDGLGTRTNNLLGAHSFSTLPRAVPLPELLNLDLQENSIEFDISIDDPNGIIDASTIIAKLYIEGVFITEAEVFNYNVDFQVNNLFANKEFTIELYADYDLNDGLGTQPNQRIFNETFSTMENARPSVEVSQMVVSQGYITIDLLVIDEHKTLVGTMEAVLFENDVPVKTVVFDAQTTNIVFAYPTVAELNYYIEFYADYNLRDGSGQLVNQSLRRIVSFTQEAKAPIAEIFDLVKTTSSISFKVVVTDADQTIVPGETVVYLYLDGAIVNQQVIPVGETMITFANLLSNNNYQVMVLSNFNLDDGSGVLEDQELINTYVLTDTKTIPTSTTDNTSSTDTSIALDANIIDPDSVIEGGSIVAKLFHEGVEIDSVLLTSGENFGISFAGLLSNNNYKVVFYVDYDLNDGKGVIADYQVGEVTIRTAAKLPPAASFIYNSADEDSITVDVLVTDTYGVLSGDLKAVLMLNDVPTGDEVALTVGINSNITFSNVFSNERYYIYIVADYDLNDGAATYNDVVLATNFVQTVPLSGVIANIVSFATTTTSIRLDVDVFDPSAAITGNLQAVLYKDDVATGAVQPLVVGSNVGVTFAGVDSATAYLVKIEADYDLNESTGPVIAAVLDEESMSTSTLTPPTASIGNQIEDFDQFSVDIYIDDEDNTITGGLVAVLYKDGSAQAQTYNLSVGNNTGLVFNTLVSNNDYEVRVFADYDLNDGLGNQVGMELGFGFIQTLAKLVPTITSSNQLITYNNLTFDYVLDDSYDVLTSGTIKASLYVNDVLQTEKLLFTNQVSFGLDGFLAGAEFEIRITGNYDLEDGNGLILGGTIKSFFFTTLTYSVPTATIPNVDVNQDTVDVDINVVDSMDVITDNLVAVLYDKDDVALGAPIPLVLGANSISFPQTLNYNEAYSVVVYADYNVLDGQGEQTNQVLAEYYSVVFNKLIPQASVTNIIIGEETITFDAMVLDNQGVIIDFTTFAQLYLDGTKVDEAALTTGANPGISFGSLLSNRDYVILLVTNYNNGDGNGEYEQFQMKVSTNKTLAKDVPTAVILQDTLTATDIIVDITVTDSDSISSVLDAVLYDQTGTEVARQALVVGNNINVTFGGLLGSTAFIVTVETTYDLNDGNGDIDGIIATLALTTLNSVPPTALLNSVVPSLSTIVVNYDFTDQVSVSTEQYIRLYQGGLQVDEIAIVGGLGQTHTFTGLNPYTEYVVEMQASYDLNDLNGLQTNVVLSSTTITTATFVIIENESIEKNTNSIDVVIDDYENIITDPLMTATLYQEGVPIHTYLISSNFSFTTIDMNDLLAPYDYTLEIEATYDVGNGDEQEIVYVHEFTTIALEKPVTEIVNFADWTLVGNVSLDVTIAEDLDNVVNDTSWTAVLYVDGVQVDTVDLSALSFATYGDTNPESAGTLTVLFGTYAVTGTEESFLVVITGLADMNVVPNEGEVVTVIAARTGVSGGN